MVNYIFYGLVTSAVSFGYSLLLYALGYHGEKIEQAALLGSFSYVIIIIGLILGIREARKEVLEESKVFSYGSGFKAGSLISVFMAIGNAVFSYIYIAFINPSMVDAMIEFQGQKMIEKGVAQEQIAAMENMSRTMSQPPIQALSALIGTIIIGILLTLIIAIFMRTRREAAAELAE